MFKIKQKQEYSDDDLLYTASCSCHIEAYHASRALEANGSGASECIDHGGCFGLS